MALDFFKFIDSFKRCKTIYFIIFFGIIIAAPEVYSAFEKKEVGASSCALGNAVVAIDGFLFALYYNPAALSPSENIRMAFTIQNYFDINDLHSVDLTTCFSFGQYPFSLAINRFGDRIYQEIQLSAGSRFNIIEGCSAGLGIQSYLLSIRGYGQDIAWGINLALLYTMSPMIDIGAMITNINRPTIAKTKEDLPRTMSIGVSYSPLSELMFTVELFHDTRFHHEYRAGCSYQIIKFLTIRAGIEDKLYLYSIGLGIITNWLNFDYSLRTHSVLGLSHLATVTISI